jgi:hypothetical protein
MVPVGFVSGVVLGAAATFAYKDEGVKQWFKDTGSSVTGLFKKKKPTVETVEGVDKTDTVVVDSTAEEVKSDAKVEAKAEDVAAKGATA